MLCFVLRVRTSNRINSPPEATALPGADLPQHTTKRPGFLARPRRKSEHRSSLKALRGCAVLSEKNPRTRRKNRGTACAALANQISAKSDGNHAFLTQGAAPVRPPRRRWVIGLGSARSRDSRPTPGRCSETGLQRSSPRPRARGPSGQVRRAGGRRTPEKQRRRRALRHAASPCLVDSRVVPSSVGGRGRRRSCRSGIRFSFRPESA